MTHQRDHIDDPSKTSSGLLHIDRELRGHAVVLRLVGEVDITIRESLDSALASAVELGTPPHPVVVDLTGVAFFGSAGLTALLTAQKHADHRQLPLRIVAPGPTTRRPIEATGLAATLELHPDLPSALRAGPQPRPRASSQ